jgi:hypothetical protein
MNGFGEAVNLDYRESWWVLLPAVVSICELRDPRAVYIQRGGLPLVTRFHIRRRHCIYLRSSLNLGGPQVQLDYVSNMNIIWVEFHTSKILLGVCCQLHDVKSFTKIAK